FGAAQRFVGVGRCAIDRDFAPAGVVDERDARGFDQRRQRARVAAPQPHFVSLLGKVGGGGVAAVAAAQDGNAHQWRPRRCRRATCATRTLRRMVLDENVWYHMFVPPLPRGEVVRNVVYAATPSATKLSICAPS